MRSIHGERSCSGLDAKKFSQGALAARDNLRFFAVAVTVALIAGCTQHTNITDKSAVAAPSRYKPPERSRIASSTLHRRVAGRVKNRALIVTAKSPAASQG